MQKSTAESGSGTGVVLGPAQMGERFVEQVVVVLCAMVAGIARHNSGSMKPEKRRS